MDANIDVEQLIQEIQARPALSDMKISEYTAIG